MVPGHRPAALTVPFTSSCREVPPLPQGPPRRPGVGPASRLRQDDRNEKMARRPMQDIARPYAALAIDPVTLEVIRHRLVSITNQIDANIKRTAFSPYIYEYNDFAVGLTDAGGALIAQCTGGMPPFVADSVGMAVRDGLSIYTRERLQ